MTKKILNQAALARELGITRQYLNGILSKKMTCPLELAVKLHEATRGLITGDDIKLSILDVKRSVKK